MIKDTLDITENIRLLSIAVLVLCSICFGKEILVLALFWTITLLILGNIRRINGNKNDILYFMRMTLYFAPYAFPLLIYGRNYFAEDEIAKPIIIPYLISITVYLIWVIKEWRPIKIILSTQLIRDSYKDRVYVIVIKIYNLIGAAVCEELFFRAYILSVNAPILLLFLISILYFLLSHLLLPWGRKYDKSDFINQIIIGSVNAFIFWQFKRILPCILLHLLVNSIYIVRYIKELDRHYINPSKYEINDQKLFEIEL